MSDGVIVLAARRPMGRLFFLLLSVLGLVLGVQADSGPAKTTISDVVYRADGTPASGVILLSWSTFTTSDGKAVAAGTKSVTLGPGGALSVNLVPNSGASPAGTYYTAVFQLDDGVKTEFWLVPSTSPTTLAAVRTVLGQTGSAGQMATRQYVDAAVAAKASDSGVVHIAGSETIAGAKQFSAAPGVPTPVQATDAVNKAYVDGAVANVGSGNYVSKAGDAMSGPLTLNGDPSAPNQAANRHYVDTTAAAKANVVNGVVPTNQLGNGAADGTLCLKGDSSWGTCGGSSNATSIQNVPVDTSTPSDNQVITYDAASAKYKPKPGGGVTAGMQAVKYATDFSWTQAPSTDLSSPGPKTLSLAGCGPGVTGSEPEYYVYVSGTGTPEAVKVTGGTCKGDGTAGTLQFVTAYAHPAGYSLASASGGLQEALIAARIVPTNPPGGAQTGKVIVPPGELRAYARVSIRASGITVDFSGSIVECYMADTCIFVGDPANSGTFQSITLISPRGRPMAVNGNKPFIEVNALKTRVFNVATRIAAAGAYFSSYVQVDGDEAFLLDGLDTALGSGGTNYGVRCDTTMCNPVVYAPGPFGANGDAVGWLKHLNITMQCTGNGVDWQSGNTLRISDSVIQGYAQYGVRGGTRRGGYGGIELDNVYEEVGNCGQNLKNPLGNVGEAGVIAQGSTVKVIGGEAPTGVIPVFANTGSIIYNYYVIARHATYGASNALFAGRALTNGTGNITVVVPDIAGAATYDLLRVTASSPEKAPYGTGNYAVVTGVSRGSACASGACTFTDTQAALSSYTVPSVAYYPMIDYWPGSLVLGSSQDSNNAASGPARAILDTLTGSTVSVMGAVGPSVTALNCNTMSSWSTLWAVCVNAGVSAPAYAATILGQTDPSNNGPLANSKGRLSFGKMVPALPNHLITLADSSFDKTMATSGGRPSNDANDVWIGLDGTAGQGVTQAQLAFGAPKALSNYIGNVGDGTNWKERLTAAAKVFNVPVTINGNLTVTGSCTGCGGGGSITLKTNGTNNGSQSILNLKAGSNVTLTDDGSGGVTIASTGGGGGGVSSIFGRSGIITAQAGDYTVAQITGAEAIANKGIASGYAGLDSYGNVAQNANTATRFLGTPRQCSSGLATGIQSNGDANCSTPDLIQLPERVQPTGIPNYGLFWFDAATHSPRVIDNNGQVVQLGLLDAFNSDANTVEIYNGTSVQGLNLYGSRTDASNYERLRAGYDIASSYFYIGADALGTGAQKGFGIWEQGAVRWAFDPTFHFKPLSDNLRDIGAATQRVRDFYLGRNFVWAGQTLAALQGNSGKLLEAGTVSVGAGQTLCTDASGNATTSGCSGGGGGAVSSVFGRTGVVTAQVGDYSASQVTGAALDSAVVHNTGAETIGGAKTFSSDATFNGNLNVAGVINMTGAGAWQVTGGFGTMTSPGANQSGLGFGTAGKLMLNENGGGYFHVAHLDANDLLLSSNLGTGTADASHCLLGNQTWGSCGGGGAVSSVFGRTGAVTAQTGDYAVAQVTGAAPLASPALTGTPTAPTAGASDNSTKLATTAYVDAGRTAPWMVSSGSVSTTTPIACSSSADKAIVWGVSIPYPLKTSNLAYYVAAADNTAHTYELGLYDTAGNRLLHTGSLAGSTFAPAIGYQHVGWSGAPVTVQPGAYYFALTCSATSGTATFGYTFTWSAGANTSESLSAGTGGTLPSTMTVPSSLTFTNASTLQAVFY